MGDLISRKVLLEDLQAYRDQLYEEEKTEYETGFRRGIAYAKEFVKTAPTIEVPTWIPVTERLPHKEWEERETGTDYYACLISRPMDVFLDVFGNRQWIKKQVIEKGWFDGEGFVDLVGIDISASVTPWMPLPETPKDGE